MIKLNEFIRTIAIATEDDEFDQTNYCLKTTQDLLSMMLPLCVHSVKDKKM